MGTSKPDPRCGSDERHCNHTQERRTVMICFSCVLLWSCLVDFNVRLIVTNFFLKGKIRKLFCAKIYVFSTKVTSSQLGVANQSHLFFHSQVLPAGPREPNILYGISGELTMKHGDFDWDN